jgi:uncharacterized protein (DUF1810 family)
MTSPPAPRHLQRFVDAQAPVWPQVRAELAALPPTHSADQVLGPVDALKLRSCLTLFERVAPEEAVFGVLLARWYGGQRDAATLGMLGCA